MTVPAKTLRSLGAQSSSRSSVGVWRNHRSEFGWWYELQGRDIVVQVLIFLPVVVTCAFQAHVLLAAGYGIAGTARILGIPLGAGLYILLLTKVMRG